MGLRPDLDLPEDQLITMGGRGHQMYLGAVAIDRAPQRFAVHSDREQFHSGRLWRIVGLISRGFGVLGVVGGLLPVGCRVCSASHAPMAASTA